jgi:bacteriorhodopsin
MIKWIIAFALMVVVLGLALDVFACTIYSVVKPDGTIVNCTICGTIVNCL